MLYLTIFYEFCKIGLFAIGGGLVTIPFLFELTEKYDWYTKEQLTDMYAISQSLPGAIGVNAGVFAGIEAGGFFGGVLAALGLVFPALIIIIAVSKYLHKYQENKFVKGALYGIRPATIALISLAGLELFKVSVKDYKTGIMFAVCLCLMPIANKRILVSIPLAALIGILLNL